MRKFWGNFFSSIIGIVTFCTIITLAGGKLSFDWQHSSAKSAKDCCNYYDDNGILVECFKRLYVEPYKFKSGQNGLIVAYQVKLGPHGIRHFYVMLDEKLSTDWEVATLDGLLINGDNEVHCFRALGDVNDDGKFKTKNKWSGTIQDELESGRECRLLVYLRPRHDKVDLGDATHHIKTYFQTMYLINDAMEDEPTPKPEKK